MSSVLTVICMGSPKDGTPQSRILLRLAPILVHSMSWAKVGGSCSLLGAILGGLGGCCPGNRLPL